jgi:hypothetical protein
MGRREVDRVPRPAVIAESDQLREVGRAEARAACRDLGVAVAIHGPLVERVGLHLLEVIGKSEAKNKVRTRAKAHGRRNMSRATTETEI